MPRKSQIQKVVDALNDAFQRDPDAVSKLVTSRITCNRCLADHPTIQVREHTDEEETTYSVSAVGLLNGVMEPITGQRIAISVSDENDPDGAGKMRGFVVYKK